jgi:ABC-type amino acid transport system permease subunit
MMNAATISVIMMAVFGLAYAAIRWNRGEWLAGRTTLAVAIFSGMAVVFGVLVLQLIQG